MPDEPEVFEQVFECATCEVAFRIPKSLFPDHWAVGYVGCPDCLAAYDIHRGEDGKLDLSYHTFEDDTDD